MAMVGGGSGGWSTSDADAFDPRSRTWAQLPPMGCARAHAVGWLQWQEGWFLLVAIQSLARSCRLSSCLTRPVGSGLSYLTSRPSHTMVLASCRCLRRQHQLRSEQLSSVGMTVFLAVAKQQRQRGDSECLGYPRADESWK